MALKPQLELLQVYNDNITYREDGKEADFITTISPGLALQLGSRTFNYIDFSYFFDRVQYLENDEISDNQHRVNLSMHFEKSRFLLEGLDDFKKLSGPIGGGISVRGNNVDRYLWMDLYKLTYDLSSKTAPYIEIFHSRSDYDSEFLLYDSFTLIGTLGFEYRAFSRTSFFGEVYYGFTDTDKNFDVQAEYPTANFVGGFIGARGAFTEQLLGSVKAGYEHRTYTDDSDSTGAPVVALTLTERFTDHSILTFSYARSQNESAQFVGSTYVSDRFALDFLQHIAEEGRLRGSLNLSYTSSEYEEGSAASGLSGSRQDHLVTAGLTITYDIKLWLRAFGGYTFEMLDSSASAVQDYRANRLSLGMQLGY